jgi:hypothetical protein
LFITLLLAPCLVRAQDAPAPSSTVLYPPPPEHAGSAPPDFSGKARAVPTQAADKAVAPEMRAAGSQVMSDASSAQGTAHIPDAGTAHIPDAGTQLLVPDDGQQAPTFPFRLDTSLDELLTPTLRAALPEDVIRVRPDTQGSMDTAEATPYRVDTEPFDEDAVKELAARVAAAEEARRKAEEQRRAEEARLAAEAERKRKEAEAIRLAEEQRKAEEARRKAEAERKRKEAEAKRLAEEQRRAEEARLAAEAERKRKEAEAKRLAEEQRKAEETRRTAEAERKRKEAEQVATAEPSAEPAAPEPETVAEPAPVPEPEPETVTEPAPEKEQTQVALAPEPTPATKKPSAAYARPGGRLETDPVVLADPKAAKALEQFKHFALEWLAKNNRTYVKGTRDKVKVTQNGDTYVAQYMASEPGSLETLVKPSEYDHTPFIGVMRYEEKLYRAEGASPEDARNGTFEEIDSTRVTEIFRYAKNKWQY